MGNFLGGFWLFLIGMFLRFASQTSYQQLLLRRGLEGEPVRRFMNSHPIIVPPNASVQELVDDYIYKHHHKMYPVMENSHLLGCVTLNQVRNIPAEQREYKAVAELVQPPSQENTVGIDTDAVEALSIMSRTGSSRLLVMDGERLAGILSLKDLQKFLSLKIELEGA
jgi:predicted transcriptional regulator